MKIKLAKLVVEISEVGLGRPVLFIHGFPFHRGMWQPQMEELSRSAHLIALDLRGHGESSTLSGPHNMEVMATDCRDLLDTLGIREPVIVCGLSMGGYIAFAFYRLYPEYTAGLVLTATRASSDSIEARANRDLTIKQVSELGPQAVITNMLPLLFSPYSLDNKPDLTNWVKEMMASIKTETMVADLQGLRDRPDSTPLLLKIKCPVLIIHGADDKIVPQHEALDMQRTILGARLIILPQAGHLPNLEQPGLFNRALSNFINTL